MRHYIYALLSAALLLTACGKEDGDTEKTLKAVTGEARGIDQTSATLYGHFTAPEGTTVLSFGFRVGEQETITRDNSQEIPVSDRDYYNQFSAQLSGLTPNKTYYYATFVQTSAEYLIGSAKSFITLQKEELKAVDLGVSVLWGSLNIGANKRSESGFYFAWGETISKSHFAWMNYTVHSLGASNSLLHYNTSDDYGYRDNLTTLIGTDDAATVLLGQEWRMPTAEEVEELLHQCEWEFTTVDGQPGYAVSGSGNTIFLPMTGYYVEDLLQEGNDAGHYWTSTLDADFPINAKTLSFSKNFKPADTAASSLGRYQGLPIRAVQGK